MITKCHACQKENAYRQFFWGISGPIEDTLQCKFCYHIFRNYLGDVVEYHREKYRAVGEEGHNMYPEEERMRYVAKVLEKMTPYINKEQTVLEIGSGDGLFALVAKNHVKEVICSDVDPKMTNKCQNLGFKTINSDVLQIAGEYDIVVGIDVIEHVLDIQKFKEKMNDLARQYLVLQVPVDRTMVPPNPRFDGHSHYFSKTSITELFKEKYNLEYSIRFARGQTARGTELFCVFKRK